MCSCYKIATSEAENANCTCVEKKRKKNYISPQIGDLFFRLFNLFWGAKREEKNNFSFFFISFSIERGSEWSWVLSKRRSICIMWKENCSAFRTPAQYRRTDLKTLATNSVQLLVTTHLRFILCREFSIFFLSPPPARFFWLLLLQARAAPLCVESDVLISSIQMGSMISYIRRRGKGGEKERGGAGFRIHSEEKGCSVKKWNRCWKIICVSQFHISQFFFFLTF